MVILAQLQSLFTPRPDKEQAQLLYIALVEQARNPVFYEKMGIPDTLDGRYEMIVLHLHLALSRMKQDFTAQPELKPLSRNVIETFLADMDRSLREMGAGDTGIGRRVKAMANGFYGRMDSYKEAGEEKAKWLEALTRNAYGTLQEADSAKAELLADYVLQIKVKLADCRPESPDFSGIV